MVNERLTSEKCGKELINNGYKNIDEYCYPFKFTVIMAVYKVEYYLREAVDSLINQTIGFEENIQLILVDDGSPDGSGKICDEYKDLYPNNIIVVHKENGGASSARNAGLEFAEGRYVNFLDSDDYFSNETFERVYSFFILYDEWMDVVSVPMVRFGARNDEHPLNYKYNKGTRLIDLRIEYSAVQISTCSAFIKLKKAKEILYDTRLVFGEDAKKIAYTLIEKQRLGVVAGRKCRYNNRKREGENKSLTQTMTNNKSFYLPSLIHYYMETYNYCIEKLGYIPLFIQFSIMQDNGWRIINQQFAENLLSEDEKSEYFSLLHNLLLKTEDSVIIEQKHIGIEHKNFLLRLKHGHPPEISVCLDSALISYKNTVFHKIENRKTVLEFISLEEKKLVLEGYIVMIESLESAIPVLLVNKEVIETTPIARKKNVFSLGKKVAWLLAFKCEVKFTENIHKYSIQVGLRIMENSIIIMKKVLYGKFAPIGSDIQNNYYYKSGWKIAPVTYSTLVLEKCDVLNHAKAELKFLYSLLKSKRAGAKRAVIIRCVRHMIKPFINKNIWLISDRRDKADDNAEAFYRYAVGVHNKSIRPIFCVNKSSPDFKRMKQYGEVIAHSKWKHKFYYLLGAVNISSHADEQMHPIKWSLPYFRDIARNQDIKLIFIPHGVTQGDISDWLNKYNQNFNLLLSATRQEYKSFLEYDYYYSERQVRLTGYPRHDLNYENSKKYITIMPTWRKYNYIVDPISLKRLPIDLFTNTDYFLFYNRLLNNNKLIFEAKKLGYKICFKPHPNTEESTHLFEKNNEVIFFDYFKSYRDILAESDMIVTDYSGVAFDFAYLRKPLIYCQFDENDFFNGEHTYTRGYFDYRRDGFGEVETNLEATVDRIVEYMKNGCVLKEKYRKRIDATFAYNDKDNCRRVYDAITMNV